MESLSGLIRHIMLESDAGRWKKWAKIYDALDLYGDQYWEGVGVAGLELQVVATPLP